jgi:hypothetical protein
MKSSFARSALAVATATVLGMCTAYADQSVYSCVNVDGSVELTSQPTNAKCEQIETATESGAAVAAQPTGAESIVAAVPAANTNGNANPEVDPRLAYREKMLQGAQKVDGAPASASNPSVSRRYLMTNRTAYQQQLEQPPVAPLTPAH